MHITEFPLFVDTVRHCLGDIYFPYLFFLLIYSWTVKENYTLLARDSKTTSRLFIFVNQVYCVISYVPYQISLIVAWHFEPIYGRLATSLFNGCLFLYVDEILDFLVFLFAFVWLGSENLYFLKFIGIWAAWLKNRLLKLTESVFGFVGMRGAFEKIFL